MYRIVLAIIDASRARLFTLDRTDDPGGLHEEFVELGDLVNPAGRMAKHELFSDAPSTAHTGTVGYAIDDKAGSHVREQGRVFAREIVANLQPLVRDPQTKRLVVCASPKMLGELRQRIGDLERDGLTIDEMARDLVQLTPPKLREQLASYGLLPQA